MNEWCVKTMPPHLVDQSISTRRQGRCKQIGARTRTIDRSIELLISSSRRVHACSSGTHSRALSAHDSVSFTSLQSFDRLGCSCMHAHAVLITRIKSSCMRAYIIGHHNRVHVRTAPHACMRARRFSGNNTNGCKGRPARQPRRRRTAIRRSRSLNRRQTRQTLPCRCPLL